MGEIPGFRWASCLNNLFYFFLIRRKNTRVNEEDRAPYASVNNLFLFFMKGELMFIHIIIGVMAGIPIGWGIAVIFHTGKEGDK